MAINPETTSWVRELLAQEIEKAVAPLRQEIDQVDDWANGVFAVLADLLPELLQTHPQLGQRLMPLWQEAAERYDTLGRQADGQADDFHETQWLLEARKMLYRQLVASGSWPGPDRG